MRPAVKRRLVNLAGGASRLIGCGPASHHVTVITGQDGLFSF
jgi:hypothetical protein